MCLPNANKKHYLIIENGIVSVCEGETKSQWGLPVIAQGVLQITKAWVDKHLSNPADHSSIVIIYGLLPLTVITTTLDDLKHRWWWETKQTAVK